MGVKKQQGADGLEAQLQLTVLGLESLNLPEERLKNEASKDVIRVKCWGGRLSVYVNFPHAVRPNNVQPFQLSDCIKLELVKSQVVEFMRAYFRKHFHGKYTKGFLSNLIVTKLECNVNVKCEGECRPKDVINLFEKAFPKVTVYKKTNDKRNPHKKPKTGMTASKPHEWFLKVYDKTAEQREAGNLKVESNLIRVELSFLDRMLDRMYANKRSLENMLERKAIKTLIDQYQLTLNEIYDEQLKDVLSKCENEVFSSLTHSKSGQEIKDTVARCKEYILDIEVLRKALRRWYKSRGMIDNSKQIIAYYRKGNFGIPTDVLRTIKLLHDSTGER